MLNALIRMLVKHLRLASCSTTILLLTLRADSALPFLIPLQSMPSSETPGSSTSTTKPDATTTTSGGGSVCVKRSDTSVAEATLTVLDMECNTDTLPLLGILRLPFPMVARYHVTHEIVQANAVGYKLELIVAGSDSNAMESLSSKEQSPRTVFLKQVRVQDYLATKSDWADLRRTLLYARTEVRFYRSILPLLNLSLTPRVHLAHYDLEGWIPEQEQAMAPASATYPPVFDTASESDLTDKGGWLILDCVSDDTHYQESPLTPNQSGQCLKAVANLHAAAWQEVDLLQQCDQQLAKASFHLQSRNPKELAGIVDSWNHFYQAFERHLQAENLTTPAMQNLGRRIQAVADVVSQKVSPRPTDPFATLIHGDYKSLNVFLPHDVATHEPLLVDFASSGVGLGMSDVAMHVRHAVEPHHLENGGEEHLVRQYWEYLQARLASKEGPLDYPWDLAWRHYKWALVDYFRFFLGRMWKSATPETLQQKADNKNVNLINRSIPAAMAFLRTVEGYLAEIEHECNKGQPNL